MATYGLGSGEVRGLTLESVDWRRRQLRVVRPKTSREICLPLLPGVVKRESHISEMAALATALLGLYLSKCTRRMGASSHRRPFVTYLASMRCLLACPPRTLEVMSCVIAMRLVRLTKERPPLWWATSWDIVGRSRLRPMSA